ncbi:HTH-type transcriptional regulator ArgP [Burkholderia cepacia]|uniref:Transcriptional regulator ArgP n=2 Tax=Burkholderia cepacia TaxID=292 RepID=A0AAQ0FHH1_BURCE|nr:HTH-type transcriptional regulator ArgP [Burkholderia cepacia]QFS37901.1 transcriptional regulator, ArgP family [Burkholderia cepacia]RAQ15445.1 transcriptional regulator ArgP [Burkholderia cepacia]
MLDRCQLETFAAVVEHQSFEKAALALNITRGAVSQRIKTLESILCRVLLIRENPVLPTPMGEIVLRHVNAVRLLEQEVYLQVGSSRKQHERARLSVAVNADSLATWFGECSHALLEKIPVALEVVVEDQNHTWPMLLRGEVTGCVCTEPKPAKGFEVLPLGAMEYRCVATQEFAKAHFSGGLKLHEAIRVPAILCNRKDSLHDEFFRLLFEVDVDRYVKHYFPSPMARLRAIQLGSGYGVVPAKQVAHLLRLGKLIDLAPSTQLSVPLYWHRWQQEPPMARQVSEFLVETARVALITDGAEYRRIQPVDATA